MDTQQLDPRLERMLQLVGLRVEAAKMDSSALVLSGVREDGARITLCIGFTDMTLTVVDKGSR